MWGAVKKQLRSVIEWKGSSQDDLFYKWSDDGDEIKNASKLIVGPGQGCFVVYEGKVVANHAEPGMYELSTSNTPFLTTISKVMQAFESEHKVGLYFYRTADILNQRWGTTTPVKYEDPKYKFPVGLRAFGNFSVRIAQADGFFVNVVASRPSFSLEDARQLFMSRLLQPLRDYFAEGKHSYNEIDSQLEEISTGVSERLKKVVNDLGFELRDFRIEGTTFDEATQQRINKIADAMAEAQTAQALGVNYVQMQQLAAMRDAARNEGGVAGMGMGLGAGMQFGQMMAGAMTPQAQQQQQPSAAAAAPAPTGGSLVERIKALKELLDAELISADEFAKKKAELMNSI